MTMSRRAGLGDDPFSRAQTETQVRRLGVRPKKPARVLPDKGTYYLPKELQERIRDLAASIEISSSEVVHYALEEFLARIERGELRLEPRLEKTKSGTLYRKTLFSGTDEEPS
jgi:Arc/MetJ-type ribon-helix-helix transcriptional regulator